MFYKLCQNNLKSITRSQIDEYHKQLMQNIGQIQELICSQSLLLYNVASI